MANETYQEHLAGIRTERTREMLRALPKSCSDFINSIAMTTSPLTRMAYTIDLGTFCEFAAREIPHFAKKPASEWSDEDIDKFCATDLHNYSDYLTLYFKRTDEGDENVRMLRNHECGVMRKLSSLRSYFDFLFKAERISSNIAALVSLPKLHEKPILYLIGEEVERLLEVASEGGEQLTDRQKNGIRLPKPAT